LAGIGAGYVDDQSIRVGLHIGGCGHAAASLLKFAIVKIKLSGIVLRLRQSGEAGDHNHSRRQSIGQRVGAIELRGKAVRRPDSDTKPSVAERHRFAGLDIGLSQNNGGSAENSSNIDMEAAIMPGGGRARRAGLSPSAPGERGAKQDQQGNLAQQPPVLATCKPN
jgi:hypothetical protein